VVLDHSPSKLIRTCLVTLTVVAVVAAAKQAQSLLAPAVLALVLGVVISPVASRLQNFGIPRAVSATVALLLAAASTFMLIVMLGPILSALVKQLPVIQLELRSWLSDVAFALRNFGGDIYSLEQSISREGEEAVEQALPSLKKRRGWRQTSWRNYWFSQARCFSSC